MKKFLLVFLVALFIGGSASLASANLILNSGFETYSGINFANWQESGSVGVSLLAHSGL